MYYLNLGSLILGLIAWILPIVNLLKHNKIKHKKWYILIFSSLCACSISLLLQIFYSKYLTGKEDWSALMDISKGVAYISLVMVLVTVLLNLIIIAVYKKL